MPNNYPPLSTILAGVRGGDIGMPGSEVYPPAPAGNQPYNPIGNYADLWLRRFARPGQAYGTTIPLTTQQMMPMAQDIMKVMGRIPGR